MQNSEITRKLCAYIDDTTRGSCAEWSKQGGLSAIYPIKVSDSNPLFKTNETNPLQWLIAIS